jgi:hypothetical protein
MRDYSRETGSLNQMELSMEPSDMSPSEALVHVPELEPEPPPCAGGVPLVGSELGWSWAGAEARPWASEKTGKETRINAPDAGDGELAEGLGSTWDGLEEPAESPGCR